MPDRYIELTYGDDSSITMVNTRHIVRVSEVMLTPKIMDNPAVKKRVTTLETVGGLKFQTNETLSYIMRHISEPVEED